MYLTYEEYFVMGGTLLDSTAYYPLERKAEHLINAQAGGQTGERIAKLGDVPQNVKDCMFELIASLSISTKTRHIASESQSQGGQSESISYVTQSEEQVREEQENIIHDYLCGELLYRGVDI